MFKLQVIAFLLADYGDFDVRELIVRLRFLNNEIADRY